MTTEAEHRSVTPSKARKMTREQLIEWLVWNDPNGCYRDEECRLEGFEPLTRQDALDLVLDQLSDDPGWVTGGKKRNPEVTAAKQRAMRG